MLFKKPEVKGLEISLEEIIKSKEEEKITSRAFYKELERTYFDQKDRETKFLAQHRWECPPSVNETVLAKSLEHELKYSNIRTNRKSKEDKSSENSIDFERQSVFLDSSSLQHLACVAKDILLFDGPNFRTSHNFIKKIITDIRLI
jgi:hypothetical protein